MNSEHEDKSHPCRFIGCKEVTQASRRDRAIGATWVCKVHRAMLMSGPTERAQCTVLRGLILQGTLNIDAAGWLTQAPLKPPPQGTPIVLDDGSPRYVDWQPHRIVGDELPEENDDGQQ
jgi:hypothetical protein